jgi:tRNA-splicing ligase RtcB
MAGDRKMRAPRAIGNPVGGSRDLATAHWWTAEEPSGEVSAAVERLRRAEDVVQVAVMPDVHVAGPVCVGTVFATRRLIYPAAVGGDIGCGVSVMRFEGEAGRLRDRRRAQRLLRELGRLVPVRRHGAERRERELPAELERVALASSKLEARRRKDGRQQLGTLGAGNHFAELQADQEGALWLMVHSGSRGMGQAIRDYHAERARRGAGGLAYLDSESEDGQRCFADMSWALDYASANRDAVVWAVAQAVSDVLGLAPDEATHTSAHHNYVRRESVGEVEYVVHRKGAISAATGERGAIPGSMGSASFHTEGRGCVEALNSSSHGAGRRMSRGAARDRITRRAFEAQMKGVWHDARMAGMLREEAPGAYRKIDEVMRAQHDLTKVVRRLVPILSYKGA